MSDRVVLLVAIFVVVGSIANGIYGLVIRKIAHRRRQSNRNSLAPIVFPNVYGGLIPVPVVFADKALNMKRTTIEIHEPDGFIKTYLAPADIDDNEVERVIEGVAEAISTSTPRPSPPSGDWRR